MVKNVKKSLMGRGWIRALQVDCQNCRQKKTCHWGKASHPKKLFQNEQFVSSQKEKFQIYK